MKNSQDRTAWEDGPSRKGHSKKDRGARTGHPGHDRQPARTGRLEHDNYDGLPSRTSNGKMFSKLQELGTARRFFLP
jgi:hypothetical protein